MELNLFGDRTVDLRPGWRSSTVVSIFGDTKVRAVAGADPSATLTAVAIFGEIEIEVDEDTEVQFVDSVNVLGDLEVEQRTGQATRSFQVKSFNLFGDIEVDVRRGIGGTGELGEPGS